MKQSGVKLNHSLYNKHVSQKIKAYGALHAQALFSSLGRLIRNPVNFSMTVVVMAVALSLAAGFFLLVKSVQQFTGALDDSNQISIFLKQHVTEDQGRKLTRKLTKNSDISQVSFISRHQALDEFKQYSGFGDVLEVLDGNPLPHVIQIFPESMSLNDDLISELIAKLEKLPEADFVQMDMAWLKRLQAIIQVANRGGLILSVILALGILFITGNTIRLELQNNRDEIQIAQLVGATHAFIRRPFLYSGFWYGLIAGVVAWILVSLMILLIQQPLDKLIGLYDGQFSMRFFSVKETLMLLMISIGLGVVGAWMVLHQQIQQLRLE
jgi:cell division transport system permease protein